MGITDILSLGQTALELGLIGSLVALSLFLSYAMLNVCDLSTDGCFTLGAVVGATVAAAGHPFLAPLAAMGAGLVSGFVTGFLQTKMGINSLLAGIIVNTGLYSINIAIMGGGSLINLNKSKTVFTLTKEALSGTVFHAQYRLILLVGTVLIVCLLLGLFLRTKLGLAIRATGDNADMVRSSSINAVITTIIGLCLSGALTGLSGCLLAASQKSANIDIGTGMLTVALASLLIGNTFFGKRKLGLRIFGMVLGSFVFRLVYTVALRFNMPAFMLKLVSSVIVILAISIPYFKGQMPKVRRKIAHRKGGKNAC